MVNWDGQYFVVLKLCCDWQRAVHRLRAHANSQRDAKLADSLVELAETRGIARALRFAGFGLEYCGAEEISHIEAADSEKEQTGSKQPAPVFPGDNGNGKRKNQNRQMTALMSLPLEQPERQVALRLRQNQNRNVAALVRLPRHSVEPCMP